MKESSMVALKVFSAVGLKVAWLDYEWVDVMDIYVVVAKVHVMAAKTVFLKAESSDGVMVEQLVYIKAGEWENWTVEK